MPHKLLLADDSVTIQRVIELTFADEDIDVIAVGDGRKAIERVQSDRPDIVLADVGMPERDGYEVAAFVKGTPALAHIPVLLLTGAFEPIDEGRAQAAGCDGVLVKPFEPQMVISRVKDLIAGRRPVQKMPPPQPLPLPSTDTMRTTASATNPAGAASVDEYFDRLDAAFASLDSQPARTESIEAARGPNASPGTTHTGLGHELANWHPEVEVPRGEADAASAARASAPSTDEQKPSGAEPREAAAPASFVPASGTSSLPTLAEAFAALLSAERGSPVTAPAAAPAAANEELIEQVTRRVIERIGADNVREAVIEVAERLVAEEIARIKAAAR